jgi:signal transduction histidine kinase
MGRNLKDTIDLVKNGLHISEEEKRVILDILIGQNRQLEIEAALERVRARTMAMQKSDELPEAARLLFEQVQAFGVPVVSCGYNIWDKEDTTCTAWMGDLSGLMSPPFKIPLTDSPTFVRFRLSRQNGEHFYTEEVSGEALAEHYRYMLTLPFFSEIVKKYSAAGFALPTFQINHVVNFSQGNLVFVTTQPVPESWELFKRFAKVFEQTYTRFLDLQQAEGQAREAQIQLALERVRARTMAMQISEELTDVAELLFKQVKDFGIKIWTTGFNLWSDDDNFYTDYITNPKGGFMPPYTIDATILPVSIALSNAKKRGDDFFINYEEGEALAEVYRQLSKFGEKQFGSILESGFEFPSHQYEHFVFGAKVSLMFITYEQVPEAHDIFKRFGNVFEQTYTRFLDLQKAEAQAREATIDAALEKVRGKAISMHNSNDLSFAASMVFAELRQLGIHPIRCGVCVLNKESRNAQLYSATPSPDGEDLSFVGCLVLSGNPVLENIYDTWLRNEDYFPELSGELAPTIPDWTSGQKQYGHFFSFPVGCLYAWADAPYDELEIKLLKRFAAIVDLIFLRYFELQKSEANTREAERRASLDRVRAETASMRTTADLERITPLIWTELTRLSVPFIRCGVFIMDEMNQCVHTFLSTPDGKAITSFNLPYEANGTTAQLSAHWRKKEIYKDHWDAAAFTEWTNGLVEQGAIPSSEIYLPDHSVINLHLHFLPFLQGMLYVGTEVSLNGDELRLVQTLADAFSTAYARYEDFNKLESAKKQVENTLVHLKQAQAQLVQSEKMASLGELTGGIAHEIQNPLNFINNFSEVNAELVDEMTEALQKDDKEEAIFIASDIKENLGKINHHGKRADAIVKAMLQHSGPSSDKKEPTNINALAEEYLRLSYHGLRAKDKEFSAQIKTDFDERIGKIEVVPQDIGRVLLNLYNNAFYAASMPAKRSFNNTPNINTPTVSVNTKKEGDNVVIRVRDNGPGIPPKIVDKIFQPFFTTKPAGQGTGLGLSLSYDIVKAHGGELRVETKAGQFAEFIITLPIQN